jgi:rod shape determining protein RodA
MALTDLVRGPDRSRRDPSSPWRHVDPIMAGCTLVLVVVGNLMIYSATRGPEPPYDSSYLLRQGFFSLVGLVAMGVFASIDYRSVRDWAWVPYAGVVVGLFAVLTPFGSNIKGAQRWFSLGPFTMQPSEFAKVALVIILAAMLADWAGAVDFRRLVKVLAVAAVPMVLVLLQPDLGTTLEYIGILLALLLVGGVPARFLVVLVALGLSLGAVVFTSDTLAAYQRDRLTSFIDPTIDSQGITYNLNQSVTAIANGGMFGKGLFDGPQTQLEFVPEQETDFIFTVVTEELGFVGGAVVLLIYGVLCWRIWRTAQLARDRFGTLLCAGVLAIFVLQIFANIGMATGIMPVTGTPLPLMSYGGSGALTMLAALGMVMSVTTRRFR